MKWYFCWCQDTDFRADHNWKDLIRAAVESARRNTRLEPHLIYDGEPSAFTDELTTQGVKVIFHRLSFTASIISQHPDNPQWQAVARGAFLRFDIPVVADSTDEFVLYTDADVLFQHEPDFLGYVPPVLAAAPQFDRGSRSDMNSGVMLLNLRGLRAIRPQFMKFTTANLHLGLDQEVLRALLGRNYVLLPDVYNWKPYWGVNLEAPILHWHGPKPETVAGLLDGTVPRTHEAWMNLYERDRQAYAHYLALHRAYLAAYQARVQRTPTRPDNISRHKPATQSSHCRFSFAPTLEEDAAGGVNGVLDGARKFHTDMEDNPWWQVDLGGIATITEIHLHNTTDPLRERFRDFAIGVSIDGASWVELVEKRDGAVVEGPYVWNGPGTAWARFVRVTALGRTYLHLSQVEVFGRF